MSTLLMISKKPILCFYATAAVIVLKNFNEKVKLHISLLYMNYQLQCHQYLGG